MAPSTLPSPALAETAAGRPGLSRAMVVALAFTLILGLPVDRIGGIPGQLLVSVWTWGIFLVLLGRINQQLRLPLMLCLVIATLGELCLSLVWGVYVYWLHNVPLFVPPGHVLLFTLGLTVAPRLPRWSLFLVCAFAAVYATRAFLTSTDTVSVVLALLFLTFMALGRHRRLYAAMFAISLLMELYGTWIGNWAWVPHVPGLPLSSGNPPLCIGVLYCALDLLVMTADRGWRRWQRGAGVIAAARATA